MTEPKIIVIVKDEVVENVFSNIKEDIKIEVVYSAQLTSYEKLDKETDRKQNGFREIY